MELAQYIVAFILLTGLSTLGWAVAGLMRFVVGKLRRRHTGAPKNKKMIKKSEVAVLIAAHNEASVIHDTLKHTANLISRKQIYLISDGSTDRTVAISKQSGVNVLMLRKNRGKAGALVAGIKRFKLTTRYKAVVFLDADTRLDKDYFKTGLALFDHPDVVAVAGSARTLDEPRYSSFVGKYLLAYRQRVYAIFQILVKYGQAARPFNAVAIVPGFASIYRADILEKIDIAAPNYVIEDYNMTFEIHTKKLGKIAFKPGSALAYTQDPDTFSDYTKQVRRWTLGFWQAVVRHDFKYSFFSFGVTLQALEIIISGSILVLVALILTAYAIDSTYAIGYYDIPLYVPAPHILLIIVFVQDYILTIIAAIALRRPSYLLYGILFLPMRLVDVFINIIILRYFILRQSSNGRWKSPVRRASNQEPEGVL